MNAAPAAATLPSTPPVTPPPAPETAQPQRDAPRDAQRDARGRFLPGNLGGPGNPFAREVARMRKVIFECVTEDELKAAFRSMLMRAIEGNVPAGKLILEYLVGKPEKTVNPDHLDVQEWQLHKQSVGMMNEANQIMVEPRSDFVLKTVNLNRDLLTAQMGKTLVDAIENPEEFARRQEKREAAEAEAAKKILDRPAVACAHIEVRPGVEPVEPPPARRRKRSPSRPDRDRSNGDNGAAGSGATGAAARPPSPTASNGHRPPSGNGSNGKPAPSSNGDGAAPLPAALRDRFGQAPPPA